MPSQKILLYPHPILKKLAHQVDVVDGEIRGLIEDLIDTMREGPGSVGVAAPQIGVSLRVCVVDVSNSKLGRDNNHGLLALVNPEIVERDGEAVMREGCMSVPDYTGDVVRATRIVVRYLDIWGTTREVEATGFEAVAMQHEIDHLDGMLFLDRIASIKTGLFRRKSYR
ncbi:peptide deformylase [Geobacter sp. OR-1]|uniref:peptide deformylase n=1 Tax=Geobacter sp. OR-1 TaxID=1266765 RepID=UPI0005422CD4|nr:peptide deformylase [Geobacter sp. OR-1]GAM08667.1 peptide deformylase [Geobacter sp. OR-1]